jgi:ribosomal protein S6
MRNKSNRIVSLVIIISSILMMMLIIGIGIEERRYIQYDVKLQADGGYTTYTVHANRPKDIRISAETDRPNEKIFGLINNDPSGNTIQGVVDGSYTYWTFNSGKDLVMETQRYENSNDFVIYIMNYNNDLRQWNDFEIRVSIMGSYITSNSNLALFRLISVIFGIAIAIAAIMILLKKDPENKKPICANCGTKMDGW